VNLTDENYYENNASWDYMSVSQFKDFMKCEAKALAKLNGIISEENTEAFLVGNYVHSAFENEKSHQKFLVENKKEMLTKTGKPKAAFIQAEKMVQRLKQDEFFNELYRGEKETIVTGELFGTFWKGKIDCLNLAEGYFVDLKTTRDIHKRFFSSRYHKWVSFVEEYDYVLQMAIYKKLLDEKYKTSLEPYIFAVSKEDPPNVEAITFLEERFEYEYEYVKQHIDRILKVKYGEEKPKACGCCNYCRATKQIEEFVEVEQLIDR